MLASESEIWETRLMVDCDKSLKLSIDCDKSDCELWLKLVAEAEITAD